MLTAEVSFYGLFRNLSSEPKVTVSLPAEFGLAELVAALTERCGDNVRKQLVGRQGFVQPYVTLFVNGEQVRGTPDERFGPFPDATTKIDIYIIPATEGGTAG